MRPPHGPPTKAAPKCNSKDLKNDPKPTRNLSLLKKRFPDAVGRHRRRRTPFRSVIFPPPSGHQPSRPVFTRPSQSVGTLHRKGLRYAQIQIGWPADELVSSRHRISAGGTRGYPVGPDALLTGIRSESESPGNPIEPRACSSNPASRDSRVQVRTISLWLRSVISGATSRLIVRRAVSVGTVLRQFSEPDTLICDTKPV